MQTYSFSDVTGNITGPTGSVNFGYGNNVADEGIDVEMAGDKNKMTIGADGEGMHSLAADKSGVVTIRLQQVSDTNALLQAMYDAQTLSSSLHGQNVIVIRQTASGDITTCRSCAFKKMPRVKYGKDGAIVEWTFDAIKIDTLRGTY